jgi:hypothetical protein
MTKSNTIPLPSEFKSPQTNVSVNKTNNLNSVAIPEPKIQNSPNQQIISQRTINSNDFLPKQETANNTISKPFSNIISQNSFNPQPKSATQSGNQVKNSNETAAKILPSESMSTNITNNETTQENYYGIQNSPSKTSSSFLKMSENQGRDQIGNKSANLYSTTMNKIEKSEMRKMEAKPEPAPPPSPSPSMTMAGDKNPQPFIGRNRPTHTTIDEAMIGSAMLPLWRQRFNG